MQIGNNVTVACQLDGVVTDRMGKLIKVVKTPIYDGRLRMDIYIAIEYLIEFANGDRYLARKGEITSIN
jgi:hypothetical protein